MNKALEKFKEIRNDFKDKTNEADRNLYHNQSELQKLQRKFLRFQLKKQGKELLKCTYSSTRSTGCLDDYWCDNCQSNYLPSQENKVSEINHEKDREQN